MERNHFQKSCHLCLIQEKEVEPFLQELRAQWAEVEIKVSSSFASLQIKCSGRDLPSVEAVAISLQKRFSTFYVEEKTLAEAVHRAFLEQNKKLALAESCTGGFLASQLTAIPDASHYFLGSVVVYSDSWKEHFLQVSRSTLDRFGSVSLEVVDELIKGLFHETQADYAVAISGFAGPGLSSSQKKPVGTVCFAIGQRGHKTDLGMLQGPTDRIGVIQWASQTSLGALWRRIQHQTRTFS